MSVTDRTTKARASAMFAKVQERDAEKRVKVVLVPGSECKIYQVIIRRNDNHISCECNCQTSLGNVACKGNDKTVCYHSMAALVVASGDVEISFCDDKQSAILLANLGRKVTPVYACNGNGVIYLSIRKPEPKPTPLSTSEERRLEIRNAMYGEA